VLGELKRANLEFDATCAKSRAVRSIQTCAPGMARFMLIIVSLKDSICSERRIPRSRREILVDQW